MNPWSYTGNDDAIISVDFIPYVCGKWFKGIDFDQEPPGRPKKFEDEEVEAFKSKEIEGHMKRSQKTLKEDFAYQKCFLKATK